MEQILAAFGILSPILRNEQLTGGRIHKTCRITTAQGQFIAQQMHPAAFAEPSLVMENIAAVTGHIRAGFPDRATLHFYQTANGAYLWNGWRLMDCIPGVTLSPSDGAEMIRAAGQAFGQFMTMLEGLEASRLHATLPGFHDTPKYFQILDAAVRTDSMGRAAAAGECIARLGDLREEACALYRSSLPRHIIHGDTKCSNLLFDSRIRKVTAVIDLDTVMPGLAAYDFGDAVRSLWDKGIDTVKLRAFSEGYCSGAACLTQAERRSLLPGVFSVTAELAVRYLTDYLTGDAYFHHPDSLKRAYELTVLAQEIRRRYAELETVIASDA